jgi:hypothetical protein
MKNWSTSGKPLTTGEGYNESLFDGQEKVPSDRVSEAYKNLDATGFWVKYKSRHLKKGGSVYKVITVTESEVAVMPEHGSMITIPRSLFHSAYELA